MSVELGVILRIDVDNPYGWQTGWRKILNYLRLNWWFPAVKSLGYLIFLDELLDDLEARDVPAVFFFTELTVPKNLERYKDYEVGAHIVSAGSYDEFLVELNDISGRLQRRIHGFTKHGSGKLKLSRRHEPLYDLDEYVKWAQKAKLRYFLGNGENPEERPFFVGDVLVYPSAFWINKNYRADKYDLEWLAEESEKRDIIVLLHPYNWATNEQVRNDYEEILSRVDRFVTLRSIAERTG